MHARIVAFGRSLVLVRKAQIKAPVCRMAVRFNSIALTNRVTESCQLSDCEYTFLQDCNLWNIDYEYKWISRKMPRSPLQSLFAPSSILLLLDTVALILALSPVFLRSVPLSPSLSGLEAAAGAAEGSPPFPQTPPNIAGWPQSSGPDCQSTKNLLRQHVFLSSLSVLAKSAKCTKVHWPTHILKSCTEKQCTALQIVHRHVHRRGDPVIRAPARRLGI